LGYGKKRGSDFDVRVTAEVGASVNGRGRDKDRSLPPAQIRTSGFTAYGSYLGFWRQTAHLGKDEEHEPPAATD
jgi:hypothetical protein